MAFVDFTTKTLRLKFLYTGRTGAGHTHHVRALAENAIESNDQVVVYDNSIGRDFMFLPLEAGEFLGFKLELHVYCVESNDHKIPAMLNAGLDGAVFVMSRKLIDIDKTLNIKNQTEQEWMDSTHPIPWILHYNDFNEGYLAPVDVLETDANTAQVPSIWGSVADSNIVEQTLQKLIEHSFKSFHMRYQNKIANANE